jgi:hypothetical protein
MQSVALPVVSSITAGVLIIGQMALMFAVAGVRRKVRQSLGDGGSALLTRVSRRHGNYAENAGIFVASLALLEMMGADRAYVVAAAALIVAGRVLHAIGLSQEQTVNPWRVAGVFATVGAGLGVGVRLLALGLAHL